MDSSFISFFIGLTFDSAFYQTCTWSVKLELYRSSLEETQGVIVALFMKNSSIPERIPSDSFVPILDRLQLFGFTQNFIIKLLKEVINLQQARRHEDSVEVYFLLQWLLTLERSIGARKWYYHCIMVDDMQREELRHAFYTWPSIKSPGFHLLQDLRGLICCFFVLCFLCSMAY